jgi:hypothetical protein
MTRTKLYRFAGKILCLRAGDDWSAQAAERFISDYHLTPIGGDAEKITWTIEINSGESVPCVPGHLPVSDIFHGRCRADNETLYLEIDDSLIVVGSPGSQVVRLWFGSTAKARQPFSVATVLSYTAHAALRRAGFYELHAAGLVAPTEAGALLVGTSGSGKSTLTLQLAASGWRYLSDDRLVLSEAVGEITAWGLRRVFSLTEETLAKCVSVGVAAAVDGAVSYRPDKRRLDPRHAFPGGFVASCAPRALFFVSLAEQQESRVTVLSPGEAMMRLVGHCPWTCYDPLAARGHLRLLERLVKQSRAYSLQVGPELLEQPEQAAQLLAAQMR